MNKYKKVDLILGIVGFFALGLDLLNYANDLDYKYIGQYIYFGVLILYIINQFLKSKNKKKEESDFIKNEN